MSISSSLPSLSGIPVLGRATSAVASVATSVVSPASSLLSGSTGTASSPTAATTAAMRDAVRHYDMTDISPNDFSQMVQKLNATGALSAKDLQDLTAVRADLDRAGLPSDTAVNLVTFYRTRLAASAGSATATSDTANNATRMAWIAKLSALHDQPPGSLDTVV